jgi:hypothetical protein
VAKKEVFVGEDRVILVLKKGGGGTEETRLIAKQMKVTASSPMDAYFDLRQWWFKDGPDFDPLPTRKGALIYRHDGAQVAAAILGDLHPGEVDADTLAELRAQLDRLEGLDQ